MRRSLFPFLLLLLFMEACKNFSWPPESLKDLSTKADLSITNFRAIPGNTQVTLVWTTPLSSAFGGTRIVRNLGGFAANASAGTMIYSGPANTIVDTGLTNGVQYYYSAFPFDLGGNFQAAAQKQTIPTAPCGGGVCRIFVTAITFNGNLGDISGADALCNADSAKPNASSYKAMLSDMLTRSACTTPACSGAAGVEQSLDWPLFAAVNYVRTDGTTPIGTTSANALLPATLTNAIATGGGQNWTGLNADWTSSTDHCSGWIDGTSSFSGARGTQNSGTATAWYNGSNPCVTGRGLYCAEQ